MKHLFNNKRELKFWIKVQLLPGKSYVLSLRAVTSISALEQENQKKWKIRRFKSDEKLDWLANLRAYKEEKILTWNVRFCFRKQSFLAQKVNFVKIYRHDKAQGIKLIQKVKKLLLSSEIQALKARKHANLYSNLPIQKFKWKRFFCEI